MYVDAIEVIEECRSKKLDVEIVSTAIYTIYYIYKYHNISMIMH